MVGYANSYPYISEYSDMVLEQVVFLKISPPPHAELDKCPTQLYFKYCFDGEYKVNP